MDIDARLTTYWGDGSTLIQPCRLNTATQEIHSVSAPPEGFHKEKPPVWHTLDDGTENDRTVWLAREHAAGIPTGDAWIDDGKETNFFKEG